MKYILILLILNSFVLEAFESLMNIEKLGGTKSPSRTVVFGKPITKKKTSPVISIKKITNVESKFIEAFTNPKELKKLLKDKSLIIIDTDKSSIYDKGHINGAIHVDIKNFIKRENNPFKLLKSDSSIKSRIIDIGINKDSKVIIYAHNTNQGKLNSSYLAFVLITFGFENVSILNGGYMAWVFENQRLVSTESFSPKDDGNFIPNKNNNIIVKQDYILKNISKVAILDAREPKYYYGTHKSKKTKAYGHIANAKSSFYMDKFHLDGILREKNELNDIYFQGFQLKQNDEIIVYADSVFKASMEWYMLYKVMKFKNAKIYEASLLEYFKNNDNPKRRFKWE